MNQQSEVEMNRIEAIRYYEGYLKRNHIRYKKTIDSGVPLITMAFAVEKVPGGYVESCIWWFEDVAEARVYYNEAGMNICAESEYRDELIRVLNYINARVFMSCGGGHGSYKPAMLYTPRIYMTEDGFYDITITTIINYDFMEVAPLETADYITIYCPEYLELLSPAVFGVLLRLMTDREAISFIKHNILKEE